MSAAWANGGRGRRLPPSAASCPMKRPSARFASCPGSYRRSRRATTAPVARPPGRVAPGPALLGPHARRCAAGRAAFHLRLRGRRSRAWLAGSSVIAGMHGGAESGAVVLAEGVLFAFADARVRVDVRGVLDLVLGHGQHDQLLAVEPGTADRREALPGPEQTGLHEDPFGLPGLVVEVHLGDLADPVAFGVDSGAADVLLVVLRRGHGCLPFSLDAAKADVRATRRGTRHAGLPSEDSHKQRRRTAVRSFRI